MTSVITTRSVRQLGLEAGKEVIAPGKATEVSLAVSDWWRANPRRSNHNGIKDNSTKQIALVGRTDQSVFCKLRPGRCAEATIATATGAQSSKDVKPFRQFA